MDDNRNTVFFLGVLFVISVIAFLTAVGLRAHVDAQFQELERNEMHHSRCRPVLL